MSCCAFLCKISGGFMFHEVPWGSMRFHEVPWGSMFYDVISSYRKPPVVSGSQRDGRDWRWLHCHRSQLLTVFMLGAAMVLISAVEAWSSLRKQKNKKSCGCEVSESPEKSRCPAHSFSPKALAVGFWQQQALCAFGFATVDGWKTKAFCLLQKFPLLCLHRDGIPSLRSSMSLPLNIFAFL